MVRGRSLVVAGLCVLLAGLVAYAQKGNVRANVPFQFTVESKVLPAGQYDVSRDAGGQMVRIAPVGRGVTAYAPIITRLSKAVHTAPNTHLVFDKVGGTHFLSEVWLPGEDGFLLRTTREKHEHEVVDVQK